MCLRFNALAQTRLSPARISYRNHIYIYTSVPSAQPVAHPCFTSFSTCKSVFPNTSDEVIPAIQSPVRSGGCLSSSAFIITVHWPFVHW